MKKIFNRTLIFIAIISVASCSDFLDINESPNDVTASNVTPDLILAGTQVRIYQTQATTTNQLGNVFMYNWAANINSFSSGFQQEFSLAIDNTFYSGIWDSYYLRLANFQNIINSEDPAYANFKAIALINKAFYMQYIVDLYGNAPYSAAFQGGDNLSPAYDDAMTIYRDLYASLTSAINIINQNVDADGVLNPGAADVVFGGDMSGWVKFANTIKLRLLLRESDASSSESQAWVSSNFADLDGATFITENVSINPGYVADADRQNPFWNMFFTSDGEATTTRQFIVAGAYAMDFMNGSQNGVADSRRFQIYDPAPTDGAYAGVIQGAVAGGSTPPNLSPLGPGVVVDASQDGYLMTASEAYFMRAEAVEKNYLTSGSAQNLFEAGVQASFDLLGASIGAYLTSSLGWNGSEYDNKIDAIMTQKWLATNSFNAIEAYIDMTRTGYPQIPLAITAQESRKPYRLMYPLSELVGNSANVPPQNGNTPYNSPIFWNE